MTLCLIPECLVTECLILMSNPTFLFHLGTMISKLKMCYTSPLLPHTYTCTHSTIPYTLPTQDGVTGDQVAEVKGHHAVCEELRKHMHGGHRPLSKVSPTCALLDVA